MNIEEIKARAEQDISNLEKMEHAGYISQQYAHEGAAITIRTLLAEVERLRSCKCVDKCKLVCMLDEYDKIVAERDTLKDSLKSTNNKLISAEKACREQKEEADVQIAALKKALELASKSLSNAASSRYTGTIRIYRPKTADEYMKEFIQQAQQTHGNETQGEAEKNES